jgi:hypothetical protein
VGPIVHYMCSHDWLCQYTSLNCLEGQSGDMIPVVHHRSFGNLLFSVAISMPTLHCPTSGSYKRAADTNQVRLVVARTAPRESAKMRSLSLLRLRGCAGGRCDGNLTEACWCEAQYIYSVPSTNVTSLCSELAQQLRVAHSSPVEHAHAPNHK